MPTSDTITLFSAAVATANAKFAASEASAVMISVTTAGFSGTLDIQGRVSDAGTLANLPYTVLGTYAPLTTAQLSYTTETATTTYIVHAPMPYMQLTMTRSAGSVTAFARISAVAIPLPPLIAPRGAWSVTHLPAGGAQATASKASAGTGLKNVCTGFFVTVYSDGASTAEIIPLVIRDGATGAGTVLMNLSFSGVQAAAGNILTMGQSGMWVPGSAATAMTIETNDFADANTFVAVNMWGEVTI